MNLPGGAVISLYMRALPLTYGLNARGLGIKILDLCVQKNNCESRYWLQISLFT